jgi:hypothetical protein
MLEEVRSVADVVVDTSEMTVHDLRSFIQKTFVGDPSRACMVVSDLVRLQVRRVPHDVDLLFDVRFLANPHFVAELRPKTGIDPAVAAYIEKDPETGRFGPPGRLPRLPSSAVRARAQELPLRRHRCTGEAPVGLRGRAVGSPAEEPRHSGPRLTDDRE